MVNPFMSAYAVKLGGAIGAGLEFRFRETLKK